MASHLYSLEINYNSAGQFCTNILHYVFDDAGYATTTQAGGALVTKWLNTVMPEWVKMLPDQVTILSVKSRKAQGVGGFEAVGIPTAGNVGTRAGGISASGIAPVIIHFPTGRAKGRGKTFLPGVRESDVSAGVFTDSFQATIATEIPLVFADLVLAGGGTPTAEFVVKGGTGGPGWWAVSTSMLSDLVGQLRRRQRPA
jgi:hypothetical protein